MVRSQLGVIFDKVRNAHASYLQRDKQISVSYHKEWNILRIPTVEIDISKGKTSEQEEWDLSLTTQESVNQVMATDVVIITVLTMIQIAICLKLTTIEVSLQVHVCDHISQCAAS